MRYGSSCIIFLDHITAFCLLSLPSDLHTAWIRGRGWRGEFGLAGYRAGQRVISLPFFHPTADLQVVKTVQKIAGPQPPPG